MSTASRRIASATRAASQPAASTKRSKARVTRTRIGLPIVGPGRIADDLEAPAIVLLEQPSRQMNAVACVWKSADRYPSRSLAPDNSRRAAGATRGVNAAVQPSAQRRCSSARRRLRQQHERRQQRHAGVDAVA